MAVRGIGLASVTEIPRSTPPAPPPGSGPPVAPRAPAGAPSASGAPQMATDPIGAIGFLLQQFSAGLQGQELPSTRLRREALQRQQLELQQMQVGAQALEQGLRLIERTPSENRQSVIDTFTGEFAESLPGLRDTLVQFSESVPDARSIVSTVGEFGPQLYALCGSDIACIRKFAGDEGMMTQLRTQRDQQNLPILGAKLRDITNVMATNPKATAGLPVDDAGLPFLTVQDLERLNETLPEDMKITDSEMNTLLRNEQVMTRFGIKTPEMAEFETKERFKSSLRIQEEAAKGEDLAKSDLLDDRGEVKSEVSNDLFRRNMALLLGPPDPTTGVFMNATPEKAREAQERTITAAALLRSGRATGVDEALSMANQIGVEEVTIGKPLPEIAKPEIQLPPKEREKIASGQVTIARMRPIIEKRLDDAVGIGFTAKLKELSSATVGQVFDTFTFEDNEKHRQSLREMNNQVKSALAVNAEEGRISNQDMNFVLDLLPPVDAWFANKKLAANNMRSILDFLDEIEAGNKAVLEGKRPEGASAGGLSADDEALLKKYGQ